MAALIWGRPDVVHIVVTTIGPDGAKLHWYPDLERDRPETIELPHGTRAVTIERFVASQQGGAERILRLHRPTPNGLCAGCLATPADHPCQVARIATRALQLSTDPTRPPHPPRS